MTAQQSVQAVQFRSPVRSERSGASGKLLTRLVVPGVVLGGLAVSMRGPVGELVSSAGKLGTIEPAWFLAMGAAELASFACTWALTRLLLPRLSWFAAATSQLASNAISRVVPGGAAAGGAVLYRMLAANGVATTEAASAMAVSTLVSYAVLFAIPALAGLAVLAGAPLADGLGPAVVGGSVLFAVVISAGWAVLRSDGPLLSLGRGLDRLLSAATDWAHRAGRTGWTGRSQCRGQRETWSFDAERLVAERHRLATILSRHWGRMVAAAVGNWAFDYLVLLTALLAAGARPELSGVLLAFAAASVLAMVPLTPGGVGFVEVGLYSTLVVSGTDPAHAAIATIAYRAVSWWGPVVAGAAAWLAAHVASTNLDEGKPTLAHSRDLVA